jgi:hypothetical protein
VASSLSGCRRSVSTSTASALVSPLSSIARQSSSTGGVANVQSQRGGMKYAEGGDINMLIRIRLGDSVHYEFNKALRCIPWLGTSWSIGNLLQLLDSALLISILIELDFISSPTTTQ